MADSIGLSAAKALLSSTKQWWEDLEKRLADLEQNGSGTGGGTGGVTDMPLMVVEDEWEGSGNSTRSFNVDVMGLSVINTGSDTLVVTIGAKTIQVGAGESFENLFKPFRSLTVTASGAYKALVTAPYGGTITPTPAPSTDTTAPTVNISPAAGTFTSAQSVTLSANEAATIYYTLDGSTPTVSSTVYSGAITLNSTVTIKYFARDTAGNSSAVQSAAYTINLATPDTTAPTLTISPAAGTYTSAQSVTISSNEAATIYYTLDGSTPTTSSTVYNGAPISISANTTVKYFARDTAGNASAVESAAYAITLTADTTAPTVNISPAAGTFTSAQSVTLSANETATIYYTLDGSTPTVSSLAYSAPISISANTTVKYFARDTAGNASIVQTAVYTIDTPFINIVKDSSLILWLDGEQGNNTTTSWADLSGKNTAVTLAGYSTSGFSTKKLSFNGTTQYGTISNITNFYQSNISLEFICTPKKTTGKVFGGNYQQTVSVPSPSNGSFILWRGNVSYEPASALAVINQKIYLTYTHDVTTKEIKVYVNGVLQFTSTLNSNDKITSGNLFIGQANSSTGVFAPNDYFQGDMYSIKVYNKVLSSSEVTQNYNVESVR